MTYKAYEVVAEFMKVSKIEDLQKRDPIATEQGEKDKKKIFHKAGPKLMLFALHLHIHT